MGLLDMFTRAQVVASAISVAEANAYLKIKVPFDIDRSANGASISYDGGRDETRNITIWMNGMYGTISLNEAKNLRGALDKLLHSLEEANVKNVD